MLDRLDEMLEAPTLQRLRAVVDDRPDMTVALVDPDLTILWATASGAQATFGRDPDKCTRLPVAELVHPLDLSSAEVAMASALGGDTATWVGRTSDAAGGWSWTLVLMWPLVDRTAVLATGMTLRRGGAPASA